MLHKAPHTAMEILHFPNPGNELILGDVQLFEPGIKRLDQFIRCPFRNRGVVVFGQNHVRATRPAIIDVVYFTQLLASEMATHLTVTSWMEFLKLAEIRIDERMVQRVVVPSPKGEGDIVVHALGV